MSKSSPMPEEIEEITKLEFQMKQADPLVKTYISALEAENKRLQKQIIQAKTKDIEIKVLTQEYTRVKTQLFKIKEKHKNEISDFRKQLLEAQKNQIVLPESDAALLRKRQ